MSNQGFSRMCQRLTFSFGVLLTLCFLSVQAVAQVSVTPATGGGALCVGNGFVTLGDITITEGVIADFIDGTDLTYIISTPSVNFEFNTAATVALTHSAGDGTVTNIEAPVITTSTITFEYDMATTATGALDVFTISGVEISAVTTNDSGNLLRTGGTAVQTGNEVVDTQNHSTLISDLIPTTSDAGVDLDQCDNGIFTMAANTPAVGVGTWSVESGTATVTNAGSPTTTITGIAAGSSATVRWTISNGSCPDSFEDIVLTNQQSPSASSAGTDQEQCGSGAFTLAGNVPTVGTGVWSIVGAANGAVITTPGTATSGVTGLNAGSSVVLRWTISNGLCPDELDEVTLTNTANPTTSDAGVDLDQCDNGIFTMAANTPAVGVGTWSVESGTATVTNAGSPTTTITGIAAGSSATVRWTISNGSCPDSFEDIVLTNQQSPSASSAGTDQEQCGSGAFTLAGNVPTVGTGVWSIVGAANGAVITTPGTATSGVTGLNAGSSVVLRWTISNGLCPDELDEVTLTNTANPTTSDAGVDLDQCDNGIFTMAANTPAVGVGTWSVESGTATVTNAGSPTTTITGIAAGSSATVRWTISNGSCPDSFEDIVLTNQQSPSASSAGTDQEQCGSGAFTLAGNVPTVGTGVWSIVGAANGAVITTPGTATSGVTGLNAGSSVVLRWTISNGLCPDELDEVTLTNTANPTTSDAGVDLDQCDNGIFTMAANTPAVGVGTWSVESGTATVTNAGSPTTTITGIAAGSSATPASDVVGLAVLVKVTSSSSSGHKPLLIVQRNTTLLPAFKPVTPLVAVPGVVITAPFAAPTMLQTPVPTVGTLPAKVNAPDPHCS